MLARRESEKGLDGSGVLMMGVDILPSELPREASEHFGDALLPFVEALATPGAPLPPELAAATITRDGRLTPAYAYIEGMRHARERETDQGDVSTAGTIDDSAQAARPAGRGDAATAEAIRSHTARVRDGNGPAPPRAESAADIIKRARELVGRRYGSDGVLLQLWRTRLCGLDQEKLGRVTCVEAVAGLLLGKASVAASRRPDVRSGAHPSIPPVPSAPRQSTGARCMPNAELLFEQMCIG